MGPIKTKTTIKMAQYIFSRMGIFFVTKSAMATISKVNGISEKNTIARVPSKDNIN